MPYAKAIAAFIVPFILTFLAPLGVGADTTVSDAIYLILTAVITSLTVYLVPNKVK
jgi:hypothetical protein